MKGCDTKQGNTLENIPTGYDMVTAKNYTEV